MVGVGVLRVARVPRGPAWTVLASAAHAGRRIITRTDVVRRVYSGGVSGSRTGPLGGSRIWRSATEPPTAAHPPGPTALTSTCREAASLGLARARRVNGLFVGLSRADRRLLGRETWRQRAYRWADVTGFLTRWNNRREWLLDADPFWRVRYILTTEYERKAYMFLHLNMIATAGIAAYLTVQTLWHDRPPLPEPLDYAGIRWLKHDYTWHGRLWGVHPKGRCVHCNWLDLECKKECLEKLKSEGHTFPLFGGNPYSKPRGPTPHPH